MNIPETPAKLGWFIDYDFTTDDVWGDCRRQKAWLAALLRLTPTRIGRRILANYWRDGQRVQAAEIAAEHGAPIPAILAAYSLIFG